MKKVVIVADNLANSFSIVNQLKSITQRYNDVDLEVECIFYWGTIHTREKQLKEIENTDTEIKIKPVTLYDFFENLDEYYDDKDNSYVFIIKWSLNYDWNRDWTSKKVNVRYFRSKNNPDNMWFYSGAGEDTLALIQEVTNGQLIKMKSYNYRDNTMELELEENCNFMYGLRKTDNYKVKSRIHR